MYKSEYIFKDNLTIPKTKDLVNRPNDKYNDILNTINKSKSKTESPDNMKNELKDYLKQQMKNVKQQPTEFVNNSFNNFSNY